MLARRPRQALLVSLVSCVPSVVLATGCHHAPFGAATRVVEAREVDEVVVDGNGVVFVAAGDPMDRRDGKIVAVDGAGHDATLAHDLDAPRQVALGATDVYFLNDGGVDRVARRGGPVEHVLTLDHPTALTLAGPDLFVGIADAILTIGADGTSHALVTGAGDVGDLTLAGDYVFWIDRRDGRVMRVGRHGGEVTPLAVGQPGLIELAVAGDAVVWIADGDAASKREATVATVPVGGGAVQILHRGGTQYQGLAVGGGWAYWTWGEVDSSVRRVRLGGGEAQVIVGNQTDLDGIALDAGGLWVGGPDGLYRVRHH